MESSDSDWMTREEPFGARPNGKADEEDLGPCASRPSSKWWSGLIVKNLPKEVRAFQYAHMGFEGYAPDGTCFVFEFNVPEKWRLTVRGRNLWKVFVYIHQHRLEWIEKADRDFAGKGEAVITGIEIEEVKEER